MKKIAFLLFAAFVFINLSGCADPEPPSFRVFNERPTKANVQVKTSSNTFNINDVQAGQLTNFEGTTPGPVEITAGIQNESVAPTASFNAEEDNNYTIIVANTTPPTIRVDVAKK